MSYNTATKQLVTEFLKEKYDTAVSVEEIDEYLKSQNHAANITTVYRILDKLLNDGLLMKFKHDDGKRFIYKYITKGSDCHEHIHLQCSSCKKIIHLDCERTESFIAHIYEEHGFSLKCNNAILFGICSECAKKEDKKQKD